jgi:hypothetical protein
MSKVWLVTRERQRFGPDHCGRCARIGRIAATQVARTLLARPPSAEGRVVVLSGEMHRS